MPLTAADTGGALETPALDEGSDTVAFRKTSALAMAGTAAVLVASVGTTASAAPTATCHAASGNLYCGNKVGTSIYKHAQYDSGSGNPTEIVDSLRSGFSYFKCYAVGQHHAGNNNIWYYTYGDDNGAWGYVPAVNVYTPQDPFPGVRAC
ncbi:MAG: hypothetical protein QOH84_6408 [Kribbellaceae bacterium]|nr:hypothetical protein [Kribbellaceae bacterium]